MKDFFSDLSEEMAGTSQVVSIITDINPENNSNITDAEMDSVPILPLRNMVLYPGMTMPVAVGRKKSLKLIRDAQKGKTAIGVVCQLDSKVQDPNADELYAIGTIADVIKVLELPDNSTNVLLQGRSSFRLERVVTTSPYMKAKVTLLEDERVEDKDHEYQAVISSIKEAVATIFRTLGDDAKEMYWAVKNIERSEYLINFLAMNMPFETAQKQELLNERNLLKRAYRLYSYLSHEAQLAELKAEIQSKTHHDLSQQQKEHFLQQQIRTIQEELGTGEDDITQFEQRAKSKDWPEYAKAAFEKELKKLERLNPQSPDYSVQYQWLDTFLTLPWNTITRDNFNLKRVETKLNKDHYGLENIKERILEYLSVLKLRGDLKAPILCLYGPPGVGKTSLGKSVADALNRKYARVSLGGLHDESEIRGHRRTYIGAMPGRIISSMLKCESNNPVIVLDEIDKIGQDFKGDPSSALLEVLDPEQNSKFHDNYLDVDYDLSKVLFIATANNLSGISKPLLDRMEVIEVTGYIIDEKVEIARRHLIPKQLEENGFEPKEIKFGKEAIEKLITDYTRESGVRQLEKKIGKLLRKLVRLKASDQDYPTTITAAMVREYLGAEEYLNDMYEGNDFYGVVTGLAWTQVGGEILFIESSLSKIGKGGEKLTLTGNLGDVMKESAVIALQYIKANREKLGIPEKAFEQSVHIHVPEGAIPKDGPSAGITMVTSLVSSFTHRKVRSRLAMTGEITLRGRVLPVGGIKEKILAAKRAGITDIILSQQNKKDIDEIPEIYLRGLKFHFVNTIGEVIDLAIIQD